MNSNASSRRERSDRKSTRLNSSHDQISYAVFCLKKKKKEQRRYGGTGSPSWPREIAQLDIELALIARLGIAGILLIVPDHILVCGNEEIVRQGMGSACH